MVVEAPTAPTNTVAEEEKKGKINEYLQTPKKKRKNYVIFALGPDFDPDLGTSLEAFVRKNYVGISVLKPKNIAEFNRHLHRQLVGVVVDDGFSGIPENMTLVLNLKQKKTEASVPVLFLTEDPESVIRAYNQKLLLYQESDTYLAYRSLGLDQVCARLNNIIRHQGHRRSRRFKISLQVECFHLKEQTLLPGRLVDMSLHGAVLEAKEQDRIYQVGEQIKLRVPVMGYLPPAEGEFLRLSAKVRRVFMGGNKAGVSWENLSENQGFLLMRFLTEYVDAQQVRFNQRSSFQK